jgi:dehydrogenase/reductase SDR family protein 1
MTDKPLAGQVAVVTGASRGVGKAIALQLAELGADLVVTARTVEPRADIAGTITQTAAELAALGAQVHTVQADLLEPGGVEKVARETLLRFGRVDILINNAAYIGDAVFQSFWEMTPEVWSEQMQLNVNVQFAMMKALAPAMRAQGGLIINMGSNDGDVPTGALPLPRHGGLGAAYPTTKAAIVHMTKWVSGELAVDGITAVTLSPGYARSESAEILSAKLGLDIGLAQPVEVAALAVKHLATTPDRARYAGAFFQSAALVAAAQNETEATPA